MTLTRKQKQEKIISDCHWVKGKAVEQKEQIRELFEDRIDSGNFTVFIKKNSKYESFFSQYGEVTEDGITFKNSLSVPVEPFHFMMYHFFLSEQSEKLMLDIPYDLQYPFRAYQYRFLEELCSLFRCNLIPFK